MEVTPNTKKPSKRNRTRPRNPSMKGRRNSSNSSVMELVSQLRQTKGPHLTQLHSAGRAEARGTPLPTKQRPGNEARRRQKQGNQANQRQVKQLSQTMRHQIKASEHVKQRKPREVGMWETSKWVWRQ
jgi:hypothetical protein